MKPRAFLLVLSAFAIIGIAVALFERSRVSDDPSVVAQEYMAALLHADANEVWRLTDHSEFEFNGMSKDDLQRFLSEWLKPRIGRVQGDADSVDVVTSEGRAPLWANVAKCDNGLRVVQPLTDLLVSFTSARAGYGHRPGTEEVLESWWQNSLRLAPELAKYHFTKIQQSPSMEPITIEEFALHTRDKLVAFRSGLR